MEHKFLCTGRALYNCSVWSKITKEDCDTAVVAERIFNGAEDFWIAVLYAGNIFCDCLSCCSDEVCIDQVLLCKFCKNSLNSASIIKFAHECVTCRSQVTEVWSSV